MGSKRECDVYLEPEEHVYIHKKTGEKYKSVTTVLSMLEPHFNSEEIALRISFKNDLDKKEEYVGLSQQEILDKWEQINREANEYGTEIHEILERYLLANRVYIPQSDYEAHIISLFQEVDDMSGTVYPETILFSEKFKLAGTSDIIEDCGDYFNVRDFKTNKEINYISKYNNWLNPPLQYLSDCNYNIYSLQLSIYAYMYQMETNKKVGRLNLYYLNPQTEKFEVIPVPYMGLEAVKVLQYWQENQ
jgi:hypothetical protein